MNKTAAFDDGGDFDTTYLFPGRTAAFLNLWYRTYEEARLALEQHPNRFLFPYRTQFAVCEASMLEHLGLDTSHPDWAAIGRLVSATRSGGTATVSRVTESQAANTAALRPDWF